MSLSAGVHHPANVHIPFHFQALVRKDNPVADVARPVAELQRPAAPPPGAGGATLRANISPARVGLRGYRRDRIARIRAVGVELERTGRARPRNRCAPVKLANQLLRAGEGFSQRHNQAI